jgi:hypothetical protein
MKQEAFLYSMVLQNKKEVLSEAHGDERFLMMVFLQLTLQQDMKYPELTTSHFQEFFLQFFFEGKGTNI